MNYSQSTGSLTRVDANTQTAQVIVQSGQLAYRFKIFIDEAGRPGVQDYNSLIRYTPTAPLPLPANSGVNIFFPEPVYNFPMLGAPDGAYPGRMWTRPSGGYLAVVTSRWDETPFPNQLTWYLSGVTGFDASGTGFISIPQLSSQGYTNTPPLPPRPAEFSPVFSDLDFLSGVAGVDDTRAVLFENTYGPAPTFTARTLDISAQTLTPLFTAVPVASGFSLLDSLVVPLGTGCPGDWDVDGDTDSDDIIAFFTDWEGGNADPDGDGDTDSDDIIEFFVSWEGGC